MTYKLHAPWRAERIDNYNSMVYDRHNQPVCRVSGFPFEDKAQERAERIVLLPDLIAYLAVCGDYLVAALKDADQRSKHGTAPAAVTAEYLVKIGEWEIATSAMLNKFGEK